MTAIKTILVSVEDAQSAPAPLDLAFRLAAAFGAHVSALHVRPDPTLAVPLVGEGMSGAMVEDMLAQIESQARERAGQARAVYDQARDRHGIAEAEAPPTERPTTQWLEPVGREDDTVAHLGRLHDLTVVARPASPESSPSPALNAALMDSGRPLLLAPPVLPATVGAHVAIAWNGSAEAARAVAQAMGLIARATTVSIVSITEHGTRRDADELAAFLAWHGITARVVTVPTAAQPGHALLEECRTLGADLLVMGAYTHSRLRQLILGGATRHVLGHAELAVLLCH